MSSKILIAYCTFPESHIAKTLAEILVREKIIACANILSGHTAIYEWQGRIQSENEVAVIFKLNARKKAALKEKIRAMHPYAVPALVFWEPEDGLPDFVNWVYSQSL